MLARQDLNQPSFLPTPQYKLSVCCDSIPNGSQINRKQTASGYLQEVQRGREREGETETRCHSDQVVYHLPREVEEQNVFWS